MVQKLVGGQLRVRNWCGVTQKPAVAVRNPRLPVAQCVDLHRRVRAAVTRQRHFDDERGLVVGLAEWSSRGARKGAGGAMRVIDEERGGSRSPWGIV